MADTPQNPTTSPTPATASNKKKHLSAEELDKHSAELNAKAQKEREDLVQKTLDFIEDNYADMDATTRDEVLRDVVRRIGTVKTVAAAAKLRVPRSVVMAEEKRSMPRLTPAAETGHAPNRNIMTQGEQNEDKTLGGKK